MWPSAVVVCVVSLAEISNGGITGTTLLGELPTPTMATYAPGDFKNLFVAQINGTIRVLDLEQGKLRSDPFLTIGDISTEGEGGLLGLAFHPNYATNGKFYALVTTAGPWEIELREYKASANPEVAAPESRLISSWPKTILEHNGGWIGFNPAAQGGDSNLLYVALGDSSLPANSQTPTSPHGKILRLDVDRDSFPEDVNHNYAIPTSNPYVGGDSLEDAVWAQGLRNPWRNSFDRQNGDLWIADVGQERIEEINRQLAGSPGGENYGWSRREGSLDFQGGAPLTNERAPVYEYAHQGSACTNSDFCGNSVIGGFVYRGADPELFGKYLFADFITHNYWMLDPAAPTSTIQQINGELFPVGNDVTLPIAFGEDAAGNLFILSGGGGIYRIDTDLSNHSGDWTADGKVDGRDFLKWQRGTTAPPYNAGELITWQVNYGASSSSSVQGDFDADGDVDGRDFLAWQRNPSVGSLADWMANYGTGGLEAIAAIPEPNTALLACLSLVAALRRRTAGVTDSR